MPSSFSICFLSKSKLKKAYTFDDVLLVPHHSEILPHEVDLTSKLTDKITFIYVKDEIPQVRVKYQHTSRWESVISADEESEAYDIVYKRDFSADDIILFGK